MNHFSSYEDLVRLARNHDEVAYKKLFDAFIKEGLSHFKKLCFSISIYNRYEDEVFLMLSEVFVKTFKNYRYSHGKFTNYASIAIRREISNFFTRQIKKSSEIPLSLDAESSDGTSLIEEIASDDYLSQASAIATKDSVYKIASKSKSQNKTESKVGKILLYRLSGYSYKEICKKMKISESKLRTLLSKVEDDDDFANLKIDLK